MAKYIPLETVEGIKGFLEDFCSNEPFQLPLIIAHQVCSKWGNGCKTIEDGYCHFGELRGEE